MSGVYKAGFTIIETMLFLSITGLLVVGLLAGAGGTINVQRYKDSATALESQVQGLYSSVNDTVNISTGKTVCSLSTSKTATDPGQSDCVVIGKYMMITGDTTATSTVLGYSPVDIPDTSTQDTDIIKSYSLSLMPSSTETGQLDWGASIKPTFLGILILRSPASGLNYTYTTTNSSEKLTSMVDNGVTKQESVCIASGSAFNGGLALAIAPAANSASDIQIRSNDTPVGSDGVVNIAC